MDYLHEETKNGYTLTVDMEQFADDPQNWGNYSISIFNSGFRGELNTGKLEGDFYTDSGKLQPWIQAKLRHGTAFAIRVRHYASADGGFYSLGSEEDADGFIEFAPGYIKGIDQNTRREYAKGDLQTWQEYCNGEVYNASIVEDATGEYIDGSGNCYGLDETIADGQATLERLAPKHEAAAAKSAGAMHL